MAIAFSAGIFSTAVADEVVTGDVLICVHIRSKSSHMNCSKSSHMNSKHMLRLPHQ